MLVVGVVVVVVVVVVEVAVVYSDDNSQASYKAAYRYIALQTPDQTGRSVKAPSIPI